MWKRNESSRAATEDFGYCLYRPDRADHFRGGIRRRLRRVRRDCRGCHTRRHWSGALRCRFRATNRCRGRRYRWLRSVVRLGACGPVLDRGKRNSRAQELRPGGWRNCCRRLLPSAFRDGTCAERHRAGCLRLRCLLYAWCGVHGTRPAGLSTNCEPERSTERRAGPRTD